MEAMDADRNRWVRLIKQLRADYNASLPEAEKIALSNPEWRRWAERQINADRKCHRMAVNHIRCRGKESLLEEQDGLIRVR
jgi:hypothetical protein